jgi:hypothetical protein
MRHACLTNFEGLLPPSRVSSWVGGLADTFLFIEHETVTLPDSIIEHFPIQKRPQRISNRNQSTSGQRGQVLSMGAAASLDAIVPARRGNKFQKQRGRFGFVC